MRRINFMNKTFFKKIITKDDEKWLGLFSRLTNSEEIQQLKAILQDPSVRNLKSEMTLPFDIIMRICYIAKNSKADSGRTFNILQELMAKISHSLLCDGEYKPQLEHPKYKRYKRDNNNNSSNFDENVLSLPREIQRHIFRFLPLREQIKTNVLSSEHYRLAINKEGIELLKESLKKIKNEKLVKLTLDEFCNISFAMEMDELWLLM